MKSLQNSPMFIEVRQISVYDYCINFFSVLFFVKPFATVFKENLETLNLELCLFMRCSLTLFNYIRNSYALQHFVEILIKLIQKE